MPDTVRTRRIDYLFSEPRTPREDRKYIMPQTIFRFYEELNDFLPAEKRKKAFSVSFLAQSSVRDVIASLGVYDGEVDLILADGVSIGLDYFLQGGEYISVYPVFESLDIRSCTNVRSDPLRCLTFVADVHLGGLAKYLRLFGFDSLYNPGADSRDLVDVSVRQGRVLLTRNKNLLKHKAISRGIFVREVDPMMQLKGIFKRLDLYSDARPFSRCLCCSRLIERISEKDVTRRLPLRVRDSYQTFSFCRSCDRVCWKGIQYRRMRTFVEDTLGSKVG